MHQPVNTVFLGGGRITSALIAGLRLASYDRTIVVHDWNAHKLKLLKRQFGTIAEPDLRKAAASADLLIIAVRPDSVSELLAEIGSVHRSIMAISLAAGIPLRLLQHGLTGPVRWARAMPSPACRIGRGLTAVAFPPKTSTRTQRAVVSFFANVGPVLRIPEEKFDAFTVTYSVSHGYHALATLADAAQSIGLDRRTALEAASHALGEGILAWRAGRTSLNALLHEAATPGGIAATVTTSMEQSGYRRMVEHALRAGMARAKSNATIGRAAQKSLPSSRKARTAR
jgi:pyrroline-5-carboxylate reductase